VEESTQHFLRRVSDEIIKNPLTGVWAKEVAKQMLVEK
jgi:hypothetical protein